MTFGEQIVNSARKYLGTPFFHAGRNDKGLDCVGLLVLAAHDAGIDVFDEVGYSPFINAEYLKSRIDMSCELIKPNEPLQIGDLVLFKIGRSPQHMALITSLDPVTIIHSYQTVGRVVEHRLDEHWRNRIAGFYRLTIGGE